MTVSEAMAVNTVLRALLGPVPGETREQVKPPEIIAACVVLARGANRKLMAGIREEQADVLARHTFLGCHEQPGREFCEDCGRRLKHASAAKA